MKAIGTFGGLLFLGGCESFVDIGNPTLSFKPLRSRCRSFGDSASISADHGKIRFSGAMITPTPCHKLEAELGISSRTLTVHITAVAEPGPCIQVLGCLRYRGRIEGLKAGTYTVKILHGDKPVAQQRVIVEEAQ